MANQSFSSGQIKRASILKQNELYKKEGWKKAVVLGRSFQDYENHLFTFLIDLNICLIPVYLWAVEFILILTGVIPPNFFDLLFYIMYGCLFLTSCLMLPFYTASNKGLSFGGRITGIRLVNNNKKLAKPIKLVLRQLLGFGVPMMLFGYFFSVFGIVIWWLIQGLIALISPGQRTLFDWVFGLVDVYVPDYKIRLEDETDEEVEEPVQQPVQPEPVQPAPVIKPAPVPVEGMSDIDLHIRSSYSDDGSYDVEEIFRQAKENKMSVISITDHNNARANAQAARFASMYDIHYIPGVEVDTQLYKERVRILGYYIDWNNPVFDEIERRSLKREKDISEARIKAFEKAIGLKVDSESLLAKSRFKVLFPQDLTNLVFENPQARKLPNVERFLIMYPDEKTARQKFLEEYFGPGGECAITATYPDALAVIDAIHKAGGMAVLSAWHVDQLSDDVLEGLLDGGIDGIEVFSPETDEDMKRFLLTIANQEKLFVTAGSDYHGAWKPERKMGLTTASKKGRELVSIFTRALDGENDVLR